MSVLPPQNVPPRGPQEFSIAGIRFDQITNLGHPVPSELTSGYETWHTLKRVMQSDGSQPKKILQLFGVFPKDYVKFKVTYLGVTARSTYAQLVGLQQQMQEVQVVDCDDIYKGIISELERKKLNRFRLEIDITIAVRATAQGSDNSSPQDPQEQLSQQLATIGMAGEDPNLTPGGNSYPIGGPSIEQQLAIINAGDVLEGFFGEAGLLVPELSQGIPALVGLANDAGVALEVVQQAAQGLEAYSDPVSVGAYGSLLTYAAALTSYKLTLDSVTGADGGNAVQSNGADLYTIAATQLGDVNRMPDLLAVNPQITDPFTVSGSVNVPTV